MSVKRLRIHVAVADGGQRLHTKEKAVEEPMVGSSGDTVFAKTVKSGEKEIQSNVKSADKRRELWPAQAKQPAIDVPPFPGVGINFNELDLARSNRNFIAPASPLANFLVHEPM